MRYIAGSCNVGTAISVASSNAGSEINVQKQDSLNKSSKQACGKYAGVRSIRLPSQAGSNGCGVRIRVGTTFAMLSRCAVRYEFSSPRGARPQTMRIREPVVVFISGNNQGINLQSSQVNDFDFREQYLYTAP